MKRLYLVGTQHYDVKGYARLERLLNRFHPDVVSLELDQTRADAYDLVDSLLFPVDVLCERLAASAPGVRQDTAKVAAETEGFEYRCAQAYCSRTKALLVLSDKMTIEEMMTVGAAEFPDMLCMSPHELQSQIEHNYGLAEMPVDATFSDDGRDAYTERVIRALAPYDCVLHVAGRLHLYGAYHNLWNRLADLNPQRVSLHEADVFL